MKAATGKAARSTGKNSIRFWPAMALATATGSRRGARRMTRVPGCARRRWPMPKNAGTGKSRKPPNEGGRDGHAEHSALGSLYPQPQRACAQACRLAARDRRDAGAAGRARHLHPPRRVSFDLGGAVERDHRVRPVRKRHDVRAGGVKDLPAPDVLRRARRSRAYVNSDPHGEEARSAVSNHEAPWPILRDARKGALLRMRPNKWMKVWLLLLSRSPKRRWCSTRCAAQTMR